MTIGRDFCTYRYRNRIDQMVNRNRRADLPPVATKSALLFSGVSIWQPFVFGHRLSPASPRCRTSCPLVSQMLGDTLSFGYVCALADAKCPDPGSNHPNERRLRAVPLQRLHSSVRYDCVLAAHGSPTTGQGRLAAPLPPEATRVALPGRRRKE